MPVSLLSRLLLLKRFHPADWELISTFMDHDAERQKKDSPAWRIHELLVVKLVRETLGLTQFSHKVVCHKKWTSTSVLTCVFLTSCLPVFLTSGNPFFL